MDDSGSQLKTDAPALAAALRSGSRAALARAITLVESNAAPHRAAADALLAELMPESGHSIRIGISGAPGAGKSTLINSLGLRFIERGSRVAVLAVDPSSALTGGSILGDKTRMENLARADAAFIRPSPTGGILGGVAARTPETILLCEAAGFDVVIVETVGTGQSELALRSLVDFFLLLLIAGAGDELQGIKKGVVEIADALVVNKADGDNMAAAEAARANFQGALRYVAPATAGWATPALTASALTGRGIDEILSAIDDFLLTTKASGLFAERRQSQRREWLHAALERQLIERARNHPALRAALPKIEDAVVKGEMPPALAAAKLLKRLFPDN